MGGAEATLAAIYTSGDYVESGGMLSHGAADGADGCDAARLFDKMLKDTKPADIPVEQPTNLSSQPI